MHVRLVLLLVLSAATTRADDEPLVTVDGRPVTRADLEFEFVTSGVPEEARPRVRQRYLEALVESRLLAGFLAKRKVTAEPELVDQQVTRIRRLIARRELDPDEVLAKVGYDDETLRRKLELPVAWEAYARQVVRPAEVRAYWDKHRARFDGTKLSARQILRRLPADANDDDVEEAMTLLAGLRTRIADGELEFTAAAREHSEAPSARNGGDVGTFPYRGRMPVTFTEHVFGLEANDLSEPFRSPFGVHLVQVTAVEPGGYSLEDVRTLVFDALADEVRSRLIARERESAKIEWHDR